MGTVWPRCGGRQRQADHWDPGLPDYSVNSWTAMATQQNSVSGIKGEGAAEGRGERRRRRRRHFAFLDWQWWHMPWLPAFGMHRPLDLWVPSKMFYSASSRLQKRNLASKPKGGWGSKILCKDISTDIILASWHVLSFSLKFLGTSYTRFFGHTRLCNIVFVKSHETCNTWAIYSAKDSDAIGCLATTVVHSCPVCLYMETRVCVCVWLIDWLWIKSKSPPWPIFPFSQTCTIRRVGTDQFYVYLIQAGE